MATEPGGDYIQREIRRRMNALALSARELSKRAVLGESAVKEILNGKSRHPRSDTLAKLARALGCSVGDLTGDRAQNLKVEVRPAAVVREVLVTASAGGGSFPDAEHTVAEWRFPTEWLRGEIRNMAAELRVITIDGDSMSPTLEPGDKVVVDMSGTTPSPPGIFALWDGLALVAKRLEYIEGSEPATVRILSDNLRYRAYERTADEIKIVGRIRGRWQRL